MKKIILLAAAGLATATLFATIASCTTDPNSSPVSVPSSPRSTTYAPTTAYPAPAPTSTYSAPVATPSDFTLDVVILSKSCFGSAGCNVTYRITPHADASCPSTCTVTYEVIGGEDSQIDSFTMTDYSASIKQSEMISTKSSKATLTAKVTSVLSN